MTSSLVGSEMCIRDSRCGNYGRRQFLLEVKDGRNYCADKEFQGQQTPTVSYTHLTLPTICSV
eukprot:12254671-Prorocentrum_lima.AAC.1